MCRRQRPETILFRATYTGSFFPIFFFIFARVGERAGHGRGRRDLERGRMPNKG